MTIRHSTALLVIVLFVLGPTRTAVAEPAAAPNLIAGPLEADGSFGFTSLKTKPKKIEKDIANQRRSASGIACAGELCVIVFDEGRTARFAKLTEAGFEARPAALELRAGDPKSELDTEAAAIGGKALYVVGSHAKGRTELSPGDKGYDAVAADLDQRRCKPHPDARGLFRFTTDDATGLPAPGAKAEEPVGDGLLGALKGTPLAAGKDLCLGLGKGLDIEGLAFKGDRLFFGFRGPKPAYDRAFVVSAGADALFTGADPKVEVMEVSVGEGRAIRDMQAVEDGFLILAGPDDVPANKDKAFSFIRWNGAAMTDDLGALPVADKLRKQPGCDDKETKPEAISAVATADGWKVAVLSDGMCDGGPMWFDVKRP